MIKLVVFDLDNTLAGHGEGVTDATIKQIRLLEDKNINIAICSGKTAFYITGLLRQLQLKNPIVVGENGAEMQLGIDLPPKTFSLIDISKEKIDRLEWIRSEIKEMFNNKIWFQNNRFSVSPFPTTEEGFEVIQNFINENPTKFEGLIVYRHNDCYDIIPSEVNKRAGLEKVLDVLGILPSEMIAVGDGVSDYPMFELAGLSVGINVKDLSKVNVNFENINDAINYILKDEILNKEY